MNRKVGERCLAARSLATYRRSGVVPTREAIRLVETKTIGRKAVANVALKAGTVINTFQTPVLNRPTMHTVQFDEHIHVAPTDGAEFISHWCEDTNTRIVVAEDRQSAQFVTTCDIEPGQDLSFNYNTTEWDMNSTFFCACPSCVASQSGPRNIRGFKHLSLSERSAIAAETSPLIREMAFDETVKHLSVLEEIQQNEEDIYFSLAGTKVAAG